MSTALTLDDLRALAVTVDLPTAGKAYGLGARFAYDLHQRGEFPVPVLKLGRLLRVRRSDLLADLAPELLTTPDMDAAVPARTADVTTTSEQDSPDEQRLMLRAVKPA